MPIKFMSPSVEVKKESDDKEPLLKLLLHERYSNVASCILLLLSNDSRASSVISLASLGASSVRSSNNDPHATFSNHIMLDHISSSPSSSAGSSSSSSPCRSPSASENVRLPLLEMASTVPLVKPLRDLDSFHDWEATLLANLRFHGLESFLTDGAEPKPDHPDSLAFAQ